MGHRYGTEFLFTGVIPPQCSTNHHGSGYYNHILDCIICYPIVMLTSNYTVLDYLALSMKISGNILGIVDTIICGVALHWNSCTHGLPLKYELLHDGIFWCEWYLVVHTDIFRGRIKEDSASLVYLRGDFVSYVPKHSHLNPWFRIVRKMIFPGYNWFLIDDTSNYLSLICLIPVLNLFLTYLTDKLHT